ncbi:hypothetical protein [Diaphorobacter aerolatus]|uniref:Uncharacterized protein n=1 Tax=Diaphorobacter aerolatus TaxID=1288495 RepID=A0A7H0GG04_9BURK|nr:hypothetical protein [Diaphorobacter aerolatus]QNP47220.1 hypothetical protein H9K75_12560 [Diaphorobacter aerolatus]
MTSFVRTDATMHHAGVERVQRAANNLSNSSVSLSATFARFANIGKSWADARRRAKEEESHYNLALREARMIADLSRAMNGVAVDNIRRYD